LSENGNGELAALLQVKKAYRKALAELEAEEREAYEKRLAERTKAERERYLEQIVDVIFQGPSSQPEAKTKAQVKEDLAVAGRSRAHKFCSTCGNRVGKDALVCWRCDSPLERI